MLRNSSTYIYLAVALGLFCYLTFIDKKIPGTKEREEAETQLFELNPDDVIGLEITNVHGFFIFQKDRQPLGNQEAGQHARRRRHRRRRHQPDRLRPAAADHRGRWQLRQRHGQPEGMGPHPARRARRHPHQGQAVRTARRTQDGDQRQRLRPRFRTKERAGPDHSQHGQGRPGKGPFRFPQPQRLRFRRGQSDPGRHPHRRHARPPPASSARSTFKDGKWTLQLPLVARASDTDVQALLGKILGLRAVDFVTDDASNLSPTALPRPPRRFPSTLQESDEPMVLADRRPRPGQARSGLCPAAQVQLRLHADQEQRR